MRPLHCKLECPISKQDTYLTFSIIDVTTLDSLRKEGVIGNLKTCSLRTNIGLNVCSDCPLAAEFINKPASLK